jgi:hypothetical protein
MARNRPRNQIFTSAARARFAYTGRDDRVISFYLLPKLGGNFDLRGFGPYRFHDDTRS